MITEEELEHAEVMLILKYGSLSNVPWFDPAIPQTAAEAAVVRNYLDNRYLNISVV
jgi:hypothetical protein